MTRSFNVLGVRVDDVTMDEAVACVKAFLQEPGGKTRQIATVNPEFVVRARHLPEFARALGNCDLNIPDGLNLVRSARFLGFPVRQRVAGSDLVWALASVAEENGWRLFLLGAREGIAQEAAEKLRARYRRLEIPGVWAGSPSPEEERPIVDRVNASGADVLLVAYGAPAQDLWIARNRDRLRPRVTMGVGGTFDFIAGRVPRAPAWMQRAGLEWLFRLARQPRRMKRQLALLEFVWLVAQARLTGNGKPPSKLGGGF